MLWTDDPERDYDRYLAEQDEKLAACPVCTDCGDPIQSWFAYNVNGEYYCETCFNDRFLHGDEPRGCSICGFMAEPYYIINDEVLCAHCADEEYREDIT